MNTERIWGLDGYWYLYYYYKRGTSNDYLTLRLDEFKDGNTRAIEIFSTLCKNSILNTKGIKFDYVARVLGSNETTPLSNAKVAHLAKAISVCVDAAFIPQLLKKTRITQPLKFLNKAQRRKEMEGVYAINNHYNLTDKSVLIVDDITTTGTSFLEIARAIKEIYPTAKVYGFSLARTKDPTWILKRDPKNNEPAWIDAYKSLAI